MTLQQLMYYVTTAECGNITEAAEKLFISQPSLSNAIHNLEKEMGIVAFVRSNKGVVLTRDGEKLLSFSRMLLEQADIMKEHFGTGEKRTPKFSVSCQHYSFAVNAFVDLIKEYDADQYSFIIRETQTGEIIDDVAGGRSEIGIIYLSENNEEVLSKMLKKNELVFEELFIANPHVFICKEHPLAKKDIIKVECSIDALDLDILGFIDHNITVNIIKGDTIVEKRKLHLPKQVKNVIRCKNPRCITSIEQELDQIFILTDKEHAVYRCKYCEEKFRSLK